MSIKKELADALIDVFLQGICHSANLYTKVPYAIISDYGTYYSTIGTMPKHIFGEHRPCLELSIDIYEISTGGCEILDKYVLMSHVNFVL